MPIGIGVNKWGKNPPTFGSGTTNLEFTWTAKGSWKDLSDDSHPNRLGLAWTKDTNWRINTAAQPRAWWQWFCNGNPNSVPEHFKNLQVPGPDVDLTMDSLDYFLTTNLLYPGKHVFQVDTPSSDSTAKGLALPRDLILTGTIKAT